MSTTTGPDLSAGVAAVERLMDDTVRFTVATVETDQRHINPETLRLDKADPSETALYEGRCKVKPAGGAAPVQTEEGGVVLGLDSYRIDIPIGEPSIPEGALGVITSSRRFPHAVGQTYVVKRIVTKTLAVQASYLVERRIRVDT